MVSRGEIRRLVHVVVIVGLVIAGGPPAMEFVDSGGVKEASAQLGLNQPPADNPWNKPVVSVYIAGSGLSEERRQLTVSELRHWENHSQEYADANVSFVITDDKDDADIQILYLEDVVCGAEADPESSIGCARMRTENRSGKMVDAQINIEKGYPDDPTRTVIRHELGHLFGLDHTDSEEVPFMYPVTRTDG